MIYKLLISLVFIAVLAGIGGFIALSVWDVPVEQKTVEKSVDSSKLLEKSSE